MPLQNRVTPFGEIVANPARGTMMGNRGGRFHRSGKTLGRRRWASHHWICCELHWKGKHHEPMGDGYTSLFFLDEVTALAAGHRPCFFCRRKDAKRFLSLGDELLNADAADRIAHRQRLTSQSSLQTGLGSLPDGAMAAISGEAFAVRGAHLLRWSFGGYKDSILRAPDIKGQILTPPLYVCILKRGYVPRWHETATAFSESPLSGTPG